MKNIAITFLILFFGLTGFSQATYYWVGNASGTWNTASSWNTSLDGSGSNRSTTNAADVLIFDGSNIGGAIPATGTVTPVITGSFIIGQLFLQNAADVILQRNVSGTSSITINGDGTTTDDLTISTNSILTIKTLTGFGINFVLGVLNTSIATGTIQGTLNINDAGSGTSRVTVTNPGSLLFASGSVLNSNVSLASSYPFGTGSTSPAAASLGVIFQSNSKCRFLGGNSIFANTSGFNPVKFNTGSTLEMNAAQPTGLFNSRTLANVEVKSGVTMTLTESFYNIDTLNINSGGTFNLRTSGTNPISGNIINDGTFGAAVGYTTANLVFIGSVPQTVSGSGTFNNIGNITIGTDADVTLNSNLSISGSSTSSVTGKLNTQTYTLNGTGNIQFRPSATANSLATIVSGSNTVTFDGAGPYGSANIALGAKVTGDGIQPNTYIISTNSASFLFIMSKPAIADYPAFSGNITIANNPATLQTANAGGADGSIATTGTKTFGTGTNYVFNTATIAPFSVGSATATGNVTFNASATSNKATQTIGGTLILNAATLSIGPNTLTLNGAVSGTGTLTGSSTSNLVIGGTAGTLNFTNGGRSLNNLTLNNTSSATLGTALDVYGTIALTTASLNLNTQNLTLKSNATGTARIGNLTGSTITGATNVTMERWIPLRGNSATGGRAYRLLAPTVNTSGSIKANWMEGGMNPAIGTNVDPLATFGTQISGSGGNTNGFDVTQSNASSLYTAVNAVTPTYSAVGNTSTGLNALTGYFLYIRGDRSVSMQVPLGTNMPTTSTTLRTTGALVTGTQTAFTNAYVGGGALNLVTNPYPSPIDWSLVKAASSNITNFYTLWDPNIGTRGGFVTVNTTGIPSAGTANQYIQPGQAFFVEHDNVGAAPLVSIQENQKTAGNNNTVFIVAAPPVESFSVGLFFTEDSGYRRQADGVTVLYDNVYSASVNTEDAKEINNWDENIAVNRDNRYLSIEGRPVIITRDTIPLFMNNMKQRSYEFEFTPSIFTNIGLKAELVDKYLNTKALLSIMQNSVVPFSITTDPASAATDRFTILFSPVSPLAIDVLTISAKVKSNGVQVDWSSKSEKDMDRYELERSFNGISFIKINTTVATGNSPVAVNYSRVDADAQVGNNFYRIKAIDKAGIVKYTDVVKVNFGKTNSAITISPNPVIGNIIKLRLSNVEKGNYEMVVYNSQGQTIYSTQLQHVGGSGVIPVTLVKYLANGIYKLVLTGQHIRVTSSFIKN